MELRILCAERGGIVKQQPVLPLAHGARSGTDAEEDGEREVQPTGVRGHRLLVAADHFVVEIHRRRATGDPAYE